MSNKYTPGPWKVGETWAATDGRSINIYPIATTPDRDPPMGHVEGKHAPIAEVRLLDVDYSEQSLANARLIAAAPEMLHALNLASAYFRDCARHEEAEERRNGRSPVSKSFAGYVKLLGSAIAKATGEDADKRIKESA